MTAATRCTWPEGCARTTRSPDGRCQDHHGIAAAAAPRFAAAMPPPPAISATAAIAAGAAHPKVLKGYQREAVEAVAARLRQRDRTVLSAACGMGKTVMAQEIIRRHHEDSPDTGTYLFLTSGIRLTDQSRGDFEADGIVEGMAALTVHSETAAGRNPDPEAQRAAIRELLTRPADGPRIIFCTYDSAHHVAAVQRELRHDFDMTVLDESHRLSGDYSFKARRTGGEATGQIPRVFFDSVPGSVRSQQRVFLTATPSFEEESEADVAALFTGSARAAARKRSVAERPTEALLRQRALAEDSGTATPLTALAHTNADLFGDLAVSYDIEDAVRLHALTPVEQTMAVVRTRIPHDRGAARVRYEELRLAPDGSSAAEGMAAPTYAAIGGAAQALADSDEAHSVLAFLPSIQGTRDFAEHWRATVRASAGSAARLPHAALRAIADSPAAHTAEEVRGARLALLANHAAVAAASSDDPQAVQDAAFHHFDEDRQAECSCGGRAAGGWCACARIVANVDLFTQGIDIRRIDTVVQANHNRLSDTALTQAIGRAARLHPAKRSARVVVPALTTDAPEADADSLINARTVASTLRGWSRLNRGVTRAAFADRQMRGGDAKPVRILGGSAALRTDEMTERVSGSALSSLLLMRAYDTVRNRVDAAHLNDPGWPADSSAASRRIREAAYRADAEASASTEAEQIVADSRYPAYDGELHALAASRHAALVGRWRGRDRHSLSRAEQLVLRMDGRAGIDGTDAQADPNNPNNLLHSLTYGGELFAEDLRAMGMDGARADGWAQPAGANNTRRLRHDERYARPYAAWAGDTV